MDKKYIADKRNKSKKYKNNKYSKKEETTHEKEEVTYETLEDVVPPNNWSRYELSDNNDTSQTDGADFETLLLAPISTESHFKFKSEKNWDEDIKSQTELSKYFTLNITLLNEGISCVPFTKRHGYDDSLISPLELESLKMISETNLAQYNETLDRLFPAKSEIIIKKNVDVIEPLIQNDILETQKNITKKENIPEIKEIVNITSTVCNDNVDDLLDLKSPAIQEIDEFDIKVDDPLLEKIEPNKVVAPQSKVDLEQWLDDILED